MWVWGKKNKETGRGSPTQTIDASMGEEEQNRKQKGEQKKETGSAPNAGNWCSYGGRRAKQKEEQKKEMEWDPNPATGKTQQKQTFKALRESEYLIEEIKMRVKIKIKLQNGDNFDSVNGGSE